MNAFEKEIREKFSAAVEARGCFIVDVEADADNNITVMIEAMDRSIDLEDCIALDKVFHEIWNQDEMDYALTMTSAGLDLPFMDLRQYIKAKGTMVEVQAKGGKKFVAELVDADEQGVTVRYKAKEAVEGKKKKVEVEHTDVLPFDQVNSVRPYITFD
ncbi:MAG: ribosome assembly cofactor RimP [Bacteroidales bacterium]|nr:ribosome assembly cofactor RimP [Bacteroidales bacterium]